LRQPPRLRAPTMPPSLRRCARSGRRATLPSPLQPSACCTSQPGTLSATDCRPGRQRWCGARTFRLARPPSTRLREAMWWR
jgi:hypothetical protein